MSKIEELTKIKCSDGVVYYKISDICNIARGKVMSKDYIRENAGEYPVYSSQTENDGELGRISTYEYSGEYLTWTTDGANAGTVFYREGKFSVTNVCGLLKIKRKDVMYKYLYYALSLEAPKHVNQGMGNAKLMSNVMADIEIPVPPIEIQNEIVCVLDKFKELEVELQVELKARIKQYEYYKNSLLSRSDNVETVRLDSVCGIYDGTHQTPKYIENGVPFVSVENIDDLNGTMKYISYEAYQKFKIKPQIGDVFMTRITAGVIGKCAVVNSNEDMAYYVSLALLRPDEKKLNSYYLKYYLESSHGKRELAKRILWDATPTKINKDDIGKVLITIPNINVQEEIVQVLDSFDLICHDMNVGLPAEIEARRKQYEYYRDKLLTFERKEV